MPFAFGRTNSPQRFQAWLAKMEAAAKAYHCTPVECDAPVEQPKAGKKCTNCDNQTTGLIDGFCCKKCMRGRKAHGRRCEQKPFVASDNAEEATHLPSGDEQSATLQAGTHPFLLRGFPFGAKGMYGHGKGFKGMRGHCGKRMHQHAEPMHEHETTPADNAEKATEGSPMPSNDEQGEAAQAEHPFHLIRDLLGAFAGKGMRGHGKGAEGAHGHGGKGCKGMPEHAGHRRMHGLRTVNSELIGQKCANCEFKTTGVLDSYCCWACRFGKPHHGMYCQQLPVAEEKNTAEQTPQAPVACSSEADAVEDDAEVQPAQPQAEVTAVAEEEQLSTAEEESPAVPALFAREIAQLEDMGFAVTPQILENLAASNGDLAAVLAGLFA